MTSAGITKPGESPKLYAPTSNDPKGLPVVLDSGTTRSFLPKALFQAIGADFPSAVLDPSGTYVVDCAVADQAGTVDFGFGNTTIHVPYHEFIWHVGSFCVLGIGEVKGKVPILGGN